MPPPGTPFRVVVLALLGVAMLPSAARADGPYAGTWSAGPMSIQVRVESWGGDCGPRPQSTTTPGGGTFRISQDGDHLTFQLRPPRTTRQCWSDNRAVRRVSSTHQSGTWRIVCRTPADDARSETGTYVITAAGNDRLQFRDETRYDWQLNESRCVASFSTTQSFSRVSGGGSAAAPTPTPTPATPRCTPGAAARITLRPAEVEVQPGGEVCFTARALDASGCALPRRPTLRVEGPGRVEGACYHAPSEPGAAQVLARLGSLEARASVQIRTFDLSDLIARRTEDRTTDAAGLDEAESAASARVSARRAEGERDLTLPLVGLGLAFLLLFGGGLGLLLARRRRPTRPALVAASSDEDDPRATTEQAAPEADRPSVEAGATGALVCPVCRRGYPLGTDRCSRDDAELLPYAEFVTRSEGEKTCPTCGKRFPARVQFCGEDGTPLD